MFRINKKFISLFFSSLLVVLMISCAAAPVVTLARLATQRQVVQFAISTVAKIVIELVNESNTAYQDLSVDLTSRELKNTQSNYVSQVVQKMEAKYSELDSKYNNLESSLQKATDDTDTLLSMINEVNNDTQNPKYREEMQRKTAEKKEILYQRIEVAKSGSLKIQKSLRDYKDIVNYLKVNVTLGSLDQQIETVNLTIKKFKSLDDEIQIALRDAQAIVAEIGPPTGQEPSALVSPSPSLPDPSSSLPDPSPSSSPNAEKCVGIEHTFFSQFNLSSNQTLSDIGFIDSVIPGMPAQTAGLQQGDIIVSINSQSISSASSMRNIVSNLNPGVDADIKVIRPSSFEITNQQVSVTPPYTELNFTVSPAPCPKTP